MERTGFKSSVGGTELSDAETVPRSEGMRCGIFLVVNVCSSLQLNLHNLNLFLYFKQVFEIRPMIKWDKGKALEFLLESLGEILLSLLYNFIFHHTQKKVFFLFC